MLQTLINRSFLFISDDQAQIVNILNDGETQSIASSLEVPVYNRAELLERYQVKCLGHMKLIKLATKNDLGRSKQFPTRNSNLKDI